MAANDEEARKKLDQRTKAQLIDMVLESGNAELDAHVEELRQQLEEANARVAELESSTEFSPTIEERPTKPPKKFIQIATGQPYGAGLVLFGLDEENQVWGTIIGRKPWTLLTEDGLQEFHS